MKVSANDMMPGIKIHPYAEQAILWPAKGRHIMAQSDKDSIIVYQAYRPAIALHAVAHQKFGGDFSFNRMSWIKPNFLWMMYRAGWATKEGQEHILAVRIRRSLFDDLLRQAVASSYDARRYASPIEWRAATADSEVRPQWDPDHDPHGKALDRRAVQLGLRGSMLQRYAEQEVLSITDITRFVAHQRAFLDADFHRLQTPEEAVYRPADAAAALAVGIDEYPPLLPNL